MPSLNVHVGSLLYIRDHIIWLARIIPCYLSIVSTTSADRHPDVFVGDFDVDGLSATLPAEPARERHVAETNAAVGGPLLDDIADELDFAAEVVGLGNALEHWVNLWALATRGFSGASRLAHEVEKCLHRIREVLAII